MAREEQTISESSCDLAQPQHKPKRNSNSLDAGILCLRVLHRHQLVLRS